MILLCLILTLISTNVSGYLGTFRPGQCVDIKTILNSTSVNISTIAYPNTTIAISNKPMTASGYSFNYTFCDTNTIGSYVYSYNDNDGDVYVNDFSIQPQGEVTSTAGGLIYLTLFVFMIAIFIFLSYTWKNIDGDNQRNEDGEIVSINYKKYLKIFIFMMAYVCVVALAYFSWNISYGILHFEEMSSLFYRIFRGLFIAMFPLMVIIIIFAVVKFFKEKKWEKYIDRGLTIK